jgi:two-component system sensor histidine kinase KdpD
LDKFNEFEAWPMELYALETILGVRAPEEGVMSSKFANPASVVSLHGRQCFDDTYEKPRMIWTQSVRHCQSFPRPFSGTKMIGGYAAGLVMIALITVFYQHGPSVKTTTVGFSYLLAVLAASAILAPGVSIFMSAASMLAYDYFFLPPVGTLNITDPQDWVALFAFIVTAVVGSQLSARAWREARQANRRLQEIEHLYELSQKLLSASNAVELFNEIPLDIVESFKVRAAVLYFSDEQKIFRSEIELPQLGLADLKAVAAAGHMQVDVSCGANFVPLRLGSHVLGTIGLSGSAPSRETLEALGTLVAVAIDRARAIEHVAKVEAMRESERLKSVLLDAITHDFRTPLTSIKISATGLLDDLEFDREQRKELLIIINEECDRINHLVGEAAEMARLESGEVKLDLASHSVGELISGALANCKTVTRDRPVCLDVKHREQRLLVDLPLAEKVLVRLIMNAHLYSSPGEPIAITTEECDGFHCISIADHGPGIKTMEVGGIFDKFYRGKDHRYRVQGTGMGLPIAKAVVEAHGGTIRVASRVGHGSVFTFSLPLDRDQSS